jgi:hypothetical protein
MEGRRADRGVAEGRRRGQFEGRVVSRAQPVLCQGLGLYIVRVRVVRLDPQKWGPADVACARPTQTRAFPWRRRASHIRFLVQPLSIQDDTYHHHDRDTIQSTYLQTQGHLQLLQALSPFLQLSWP